MDSCSSDEVEDVVTTVREDLEPISYDQQETASIENTQHTDVDNETEDVLNYTDAEKDMDSSNSEDFDDTDSEDLDQMLCEPELTDCDKEIDGWVEGTLEQVVNRIADSLDDADSNTAAESGSKTVDVQLNNSGK